VSNAPTTWCHWSWATATFLSIRQLCHETFHPCSPYQCLLKVDSVLVLLVLRSCSFQCVTSKARLVRQKALLWSSTNEKPEREQPASYDRKKGPTTFLVPSPHKMSVTLITVHHTNLIAYHAGAKGSRSLPQVPRTQKTSTRCRGFWVFGCGAVATEKSLDVRGTASTFCSEATCGTVLACVDCSSLRHLHFFLVRAVNTLIVAIKQRSSNPSCCIADRSIPSISLQK